MAGNQQLQPVSETSWRRGFSNLLRGVLADRFGAQRWLTGKLVFVALAVRRFQTEEL